MRRPMILSLLPWVRVPCYLHQFSNSLPNNLNKFIYFTLASVLIFLPAAFMLTCHPACLPSILGEMSTCQKVNLPKSQPEINDQRLWLTFLACWLFGSWPFLPICIPSCLPSRLLVFQPAWQPGCPHSFLPKPPLFLPSCPTVISIMFALPACLPKAFPHTHRDERSENKLWCLKFIMFVIYYLFWKTKFAFSDLFFKQRSLIFFGP